MYICVCSICTRLLFYPVLSNLPPSPSLQRRRRFRFSLLSNRVLLLLLFCFGTYSTKSQYKSASAQFFVDYAEIFIVFDAIAIVVYYLSVQTVFSLICCYPSFILASVFFFFYSATHSKLFIKCFSIEKLINALYMYEAFASSTLSFSLFICIYIEPYSSWCWNRLHAIIKFSEWSISKC